MKIVSFYTKAYKAHADALRASLVRLGLRYEFELVGDQGSWRGNTSLKPAFLLRMLDRLKLEPAIVWVDADAVVRQNPVLFADLLQREAETELAVYRHVETVPYHSAEWHNFGQVWNGTIFLRVSPFVKKILEEWIVEQERHPERLEQKNLASVLARTDPARLYCLPPEYCWVEKWMRPLSPEAQPVIEQFMVGDHAKRPAAEAARPSGPEALWCGHLYENSGYAKANREVMLRVANTIRVGVSQEGITQELATVDDYTRRRIDVHARTVVGDRAPLVRFYTPRAEDPLQQRYRICWTMMETHPKVHRGFVELLNKNYDEIWVPTVWGFETLYKSGLVIPGHVVPLGINPLIYNTTRGERESRLKARLLTTSRAGAVEVPPGIAYLTVCQPTFRKGLDVLVKAWEDAGRKDDSLVIYTGSHAILDAWGADPWRLVNPKRARTRIYHMTGRLTEPEMARLYRSMDRYVTATRGEGFDLPILEAVACGLPVIAPNHTAHMGILTPDNCLLVEPDGYKPIPYAKKVSEWYAGQSFAWYGKKATSAFTEALKSAPKNPVGLLARIHREYTWDEVAQRVAMNLMTVMPKETR